MNILRGDVYYADLSGNIGSEQGGIRPVLIVQNDIGNKYSPTVICSAITSQINKTKLPTHIEIIKDKDNNKNIKYLKKDSVLLLEQIRTIDKHRLKEKVCCLENNLMKKVDKALCISLGVSDSTKVLDLQQIRKQIETIKLYEKDLSVTIDEDDYNYLSGVIDGLTITFKEYCKQYNLKWQKLLRIKNINAKKDEKLLLIK